MGKIGGSYLSIKDLMRGLRPGKEAILKGVTTGVVLVLCVASSFAVLHVVNKAQGGTVLADADEFVSPSESETVTEETGVPDPSQTEDILVSEISEAISASTETLVSESEDTSETTEQTTMASQTTTTTETTISESEFYLAVYATAVLNVRSGPGTDYDIVKQLNPGDQIDVIAITSNGWYKTYNGNYVSIDHTTDVAPTNTPVPTPRPTSAPTSARSTTRATTTTATAVAPSGEAISCRITFYGPQPVGDGTYSTSTATGTTCVQGRTCAADWSVFPAGSTIYIENDPLGGDGYYIVEDRGSAVKGHIIDIYVDDESGYNTTRRNVYAQ